MLALLRSVLLLAGASGLAIAATPQDQLGPLADQLRRMPADPQAGALAAAITEWKALQQSDAYGFDVYARFLLAHPGWPGEASRRRAAERALDTASWSPGVAVSFFRRFPPLTPTGMVRFAEALKATGLSTEAGEAARAAWVRAPLFFERSSDSKPSMPRPASMISLRRPSPARHARVAAACVF